MPSILLVAHAPLATSLLAVARHAFADCSRQVAAVDVPPGASLEQAQSQIDAALATLPEPDVLILVDAFGATPSNAALNVAATAAPDQRRQVVTGVNVPMLWRTLCYGRRRPAGHHPGDQPACRGSAEPAQPAPAAVRR
jgi:mannose PTS system EIIA component